MLCGCEEDHITSRHGVMPDIPDFLHGHQAALLGLARQLRQDRSTQLEGVSEEGKEQGGGLV